MVAYIPQSKSLIGLGALLGGLFSLVVLASPVADFWRVTIVLMTLLLAWGLWRRYLQRLPESLYRDPRGRLWMQQGTQSIEVTQIEVGMLNPWLISAVLCTESGKTGVFLPAFVLSARQHWELRFLIGVFALRHPISHSTSRRGT